MKWNRFSGKTSQGQHNFHSLRMKCGSSSWGGGGEKLVCASVTHSDSLIFGVFWALKRTKANMWLNAYFRVACGPKEVVVSQIIRCEPSSVSKRDHTVKTCPSTKRSPHPSSGQPCKLGLSPAICNVRTETMPVLFLPSPRPLK